MLNWQQLLTPDETALEVFTRAHQVRPIHTGIKALDHEVPQGLDGDVVEVVGSAGSGKTELLLNVLVTFLLSEPYDGIGATALFFDCDQRLQILRLRQLLHDRLTRCTACPPDQAEAEVEASLHRLLVIRCPTAEHFLAAVHLIPVLLAQRPALRLLCVDSVTAFHWNERGTPFSDRCSSRAFSLLAEFARRHHLVCFGTRPRFKFPLRADPPWESAVTYRLDLQRTAVPPAPPMSLAALLLPGQSRTGTTFPPPIEAAFSCDFSVTEQALAEYTRGRWGPPTSLGQQQCLPSSVRYPFQVREGGLEFG
ncbi:hypothetical protein PAPYR_2877 [Paratrimastix pyriformis]|uniref:DNA repair protein XRCC2 n=1 Tax=Paratrimastix pyriformis TaxID=342808 RepID=A0ABQ8UNA2_9EUKA|nr:hypothetical protein PAPYR_2877 [Paratrimastix pyriformis]